MWGRVREGFDGFCLQVCCGGQGEGCFDGFCLQVCCAGQGEGGVLMGLPAGVLCGAG